METRQRPRLHGRDHLPGGTDPVPGLLLPGESLANIVAGLGTCTGWWRLGETMTFPALDGSTHTVSAAFADSAVFEGTHRDADYLEDQVTGDWSAGVLPPIYRPTLQVASPADDPGILFNADAGYTGAISGNQPWPHLAATMGTSMGGDSLASMGTDPDNVKTACCWMAPKDYSSPGGSSQGIGYAFGGFQGGGSPWWGFFHYADPGASNSALGFAHSGTFLEFPGAVPDQWYFVAVTYDGADIKLYVDGALITSDAATGSVGGGNGITIGLGRVKNGFSDNDFGYYGAIDECMMFNSVLTPTELDAIRTAGPQLTDGYVLTAESSGAVNFKFPHVAVLAAPPAAPQLGWAYYDTSIPGLRIWDGSSWQAP